MVLLDPLLRVEAVVASGPGTQFQRIAAALAQLMSSIQASLVGWNIFDAAGTVEWISFHFRVLLVAQIASRIGYRI